MKRDTKKSFKSKIWLKEKRRGKKRHKGKCDTVLGIYGRRELAIDLQRKKKPR